MYGFDEKHIAEAKAAELTQRHPENRYEVARHKNEEFNIWTGRHDFSVTYGVKCYVPYCAAMPERFDGFVWFDIDEANAAWVKGEANNIPNCVPSQSF